MTNSIVYTVENNIAVLQINRPEARNALNWEAQEGFAAAVTAVAQNPALRCLIVTGTGDQAFVAGADLKELSDRPDADAALRLKQVMSAALAQLTQLPIPVIAAVNGDAFGGGCEILAACDLRLAAAHARFSFAQVKVGLTTGWGGAARLVRLIGQSRAAELLLTARLFEASEAQQLGFIHRLLPAEADALTAARAWAEELAALPQQALSATKKLLNSAAYDSLHETTRVENNLFVQLWTQDDHLEAMAAFVEKRKPIFNRE